MRFSQRQNAYESEQISIILLSEPLHWSCDICEVVEPPMMHCSWPKMSRPACWDIIFTYMPILNAAYCHLCGLFVWGSVKIQKILEQIVATTWEVWKQPAIFESREHTLFYIITAEPLDIVDVLHPHPALDTRQPSSVRWQQQNVLCTTLKCVCTAERAGAAQTAYASSL